MFLYRSLIASRRWSLHISFSTSWHHRRIFSITFASKKDAIICGYLLCLTCLCREAGAVILKITYGYTTDNEGLDPFVDLAQKTMAQFAEATVPGKWPVDILPFCKFNELDAMFEAHLMM